MKAEELWKLYCKECNVKEETHYEAWCFGGAPDNLGALVMLGIKTATASAYDLYQFDEEEPMPKAGDYSIILDSQRMRHYALYKPPRPIMFRLKK